MNIKERLAAIKAKKEIETSTKSTVVGTSTSKGRPKGKSIKYEVPENFITSIEKNFNSLDSSYNTFKINLEKFLDNANKTSAKDARANLMDINKLNKELRNLIQDAKKGLVPKEV